MNSQILDEVFMSPGCAHETALHATDAQTVFKVAVAAAILAAATAAAYTATIAVGSTVSAVVQYVVALLNQAGYNARVTGTNLVVNW
jgi:hypothetical protein